jgi:hypothetical protein
VGSVSEYIQADALNRVKNEQEKPKEEVKNNRQGIAQ